MAQISYRGLNCGKYISCVSYKVDLMEEVFSLLVV